MTCAFFRRKVTGMGNETTGDVRIRGQGGSVLMVLIITMTILSVLTAALLPTLFTSEMGQVSASGAMRAYYLAEAGGRYVLPRLGSIPAGTHTFKFSDGGTFFQIEKLSGTRFTSTGVVSGGTTLESRVTLTYNLSGGLLDYGIFSDGALVLGNNAIVNSYSSSGQPTDGQNGDVGTNGGNITVGTNAHIYGDQDLTAGRDMEAEGLPAGAASWTDKTSELDMSSNNQTVNLTSGEYYTSAIDISNNSIVNITGDVVIYVAGTTGVSNNGRISIGSGASLTIYAGGNMTFSNNFIGNPGQVPASFIIYGIAGCNSITLGENFNARAVVYAPTADITVGNNGIISGSLVGETVTVGSNGQIHYDEDLRNLDFGDGERKVEQYFTEN